MNLSLFKVRNTQTQNGHTQIHTYTLQNSVSTWICEFVQSKQHRDTKWTHTYTLHTDVHSIKIVLRDTEIHIKELSKQQKERVSQKCCAAPPSWKGSGSRIWEVEVQELWIQDQSGLYYILWQIIFVLLYNNIYYITHYNICNILL